MFLLFVNFTILHILRQAKPKKKKNKKQQHRRTKNVPVRAAGLNDNIIVGVGIVTIAAVTAAAALAFINVFGVVMCVNRSVASVRH